MTAQTNYICLKLLGLEKFLAIGMWRAPVGDEEIRNCDLELVCKQLSNFFIY